MNIFLCFFFFFQTKASNNSTKRSLNILLYTLSLLVIFIFTIKKHNALGALTFYATNCTVMGSTVIAALPLLFTFLEVFLVVDRFLHTVTSSESESASDEDDDDDDSDDDDVAP